MPLKLFCYKQMLLYFHRLLNVSENSLVKEAFNESNLLRREGHFGWVTSIQQLFLALDVNFDLDKFKNMRRSSFQKLVEKRLQRKYHTFWLETISKTQGQSRKGYNKLRTYCLSNLICKKNLTALCRIRIFVETWQNYAAVITIYELKRAEEKAFQQNSDYAACIL